jgi:hypothetical protein
MIEQDIMAFDYINKDNKTEDLCVFAYNIAKTKLTQKLITRYNIPKDLLTEELYHIAVFNDYKEIISTPLEYRNRDLYENVSQQLINDNQFWINSKYYIDVLPYDLLFITLMNQIDTMDKIISDRQIDDDYKEIYDSESLVKYKKIIKYFISYISKLEESDKNKINIKLFKSFPYYFKELENKYRTDEIYNVLKYHLIQDLLQGNIFYSAYNFFGDFISEYPTSKKDENFFIEIIKIYPNYLIGMDESDITYNIALEAMCTNQIQLLQYIPPKFRNEELYKLIIDIMTESDNYNIDYDSIILIPQNKFSESNFINIIERIPRYFSQIEEKYITHDICLIAICKDPANIDHVPVKLRNKELIELSERLKKERDIEDQKYNEELRLEKLKRENLGNFGTLGNKWNLDTDEW